MHKYSKRLHLTPMDAPYREQALVKLLGFVAGKWCLQRCKDTRVQRRLQWLHPLQNQQRTASKSY